MLHAYSCLLIHCPSLSLSCYLLPRHLRAHLLTSRSTDDGSPLLPSNLIPTSHSHPLLGSRLSLSNVLFISFASRLSSSSCSATASGSGSSITKDSARGSLLLPLQQLPFLQLCSHLLPSLVSQRKRAREILSSNAFPSVLLHLPSSRACIPTDPPLSLSQLPTIG